VTAPSPPPPPPGSSPRSTASDAPPRPIFTPDVDEGRLVPPKWLDQAPVTRTLLALNVFVYLAGRFDAERLTTTTLHQLLAFGASYPPATLGEGRYETLVTACFLHGGLVHLAFNMIALWQAGPLVERSVGSARMAPMYLVAGAFGNLLSVLFGWYRATAGIPVAPTVGASGAISGVIAAALVVGWRSQGWRSPLTQAMARWLGFVVLFGVFSNLGGSNIDNAAHVGGALAGAGIAALWKRGKHYSNAATAGILAGCGAVLVACIAIVAVRDRTDPFASMDLQERVEFTSDAVSDARCHEAEDGLAAVERLGSRLEAGALLRQEVEEGCGRLPARVH
jgi:rhomboid protease GluP